MVSAELLYSTTQEKIGSVLYSNSNNTTVKVSIDRDCLYYESLGYHILSVTYYLMCDHCVDGKVAYKNNQYKFVLCKKCCGRGLLKTLTAAEFESLWSTRTGLEQ